MNLQGADCDQPVSGAALASDEKGFVGRYLSVNGGPKVLTAPEAADHHAHGVGDLIVYEDDANDLTSGDAHAQQLASNAVHYARSLGIPAGVAIFMTCDNNGAAQPGVVSAMSSAAVIIRQGGYLAGFYGPKAPARQMVAGRNIDATWVVDTWGTDQPGDAWNFRQLPNAGQQTIGGVTCDVDDAPHPVGLWGGSLGAAPSFSPPSTPEVAVYDLKGHCVALIKPDGSVATFNEDGSPGGHYLGGLNNHPAYNAGAGKAEGPAVAITPWDDQLNPWSGYVIWTEDAQGMFHPYAFPSDGRHAAANA